jgi:hypothetical protein
MEFHIARVFRDRYELSDLLFSYSGNVIFGNVTASRRLAQQMNDARVAMGGPTAEQDPSSVVHAGQLFAMGLIDELSHAITERYRTVQDPAVLADALKWLGARVPAAEVDALLLSFTELFPNVAIYTGKLTEQEWLAGSTDGVPHREAALEELLLLWLANQNPAFKPFKALFDDGALQTGTPAYKKFASVIDSYFETRAEFSAETKTLLKVLRAPMDASPNSLSGQLDFIRENWIGLLGPDLGKALSRTLLAVDVLRGEEVAIWMQFNPPERHMRHHDPPGRGGKEGFVGDEYVGYEEYWEQTVNDDGSVVRRRRMRSRQGQSTDGQYAHDYQAPLNEYEAFSSDHAWMPTVVLMAKSTYVWLEQLSKKYQRHIYRLDQIPLEELQSLRDRGMTGLWLIGLWERSRASQTIKRLFGQADAVASAYSLMDYRIAEDLGGEEAYARLHAAANGVGLRLASDMVPNHMGLDSTWVVEHPDWFLRRSESPYPVYSFEGPDVSSDPRVEIKIEDHYYDRTDAAVVYRMRYRDGNGRTEFIYHGNDGTTFAWNDTAQLDYSQHAVREHVIQVILDVARRFPIIRFDAAMVLAKRHVQRLWFPLPGVGGSIPSRAEDAMTQEEFDRIMPNEFWREVVDRVQAEVPGTLLLAEAFWLLEGYFVRTLGMHRVYNSAFMVMLRDEDNAAYRSYLKKTMEFDPDILKRYVNFMSNPDERTAIDQFGSGDKYFGVATMMATIPGLPMFGHGQIEGYTEKYGMEYKQAKMDEWPNDDLVARHTKEIAPLLKNRALFAESENFVFFDFRTEHGGVDENVFAYSNRLGQQRALIVYNNAYGSTRGTVHSSVSSMNKWTGDLWQRSLADALALPQGDGYFLAYRDTATGLEYLQRANSLTNHGLTLNLRGYQYAVLLQWRELRATAEQPWDRICDGLNGAGVHSLDEALARLRLQPLIGAIRHAVSWDAVGLLAPGNDSATSEKERLQAWGLRARAVFDRWSELEGFHSVATSDSYTLATTQLVSNVFKATATAKATDALPSHSSPNAKWSALLAVALLRSLPAGEGNVIDRLQLRPSLAEIFAEIGMQTEDAWRTVARVRLALSNPDLHSPAFWADGDVQWLAGVNKHEAIRYVNREALQQLLQWFTSAVALDMSDGLAKSVPVEEVMEAAESNGYSYDAMVEFLTSKPARFAKKDDSKSGSSKESKKPQAKLSGKKTGSKKAATKKLPGSRAAVIPASKPASKPAAPLIAESRSPNDQSLVGTTPVVGKAVIAKKGAKKSAAKLKPTSKL